MALAVLTLSVSTMFALVGYVVLNILDEIF